MKLIKGNYYKFKIEGYKEPIAGIFCNKGKDWIQILYNPVDYVIDGIKFIKIDLATPLEKTTNDKFVEKVLKAKKLLSDININLSNEGLLSWLITNKRLIEYQTKYENSIEVGFVIDFKENKSIFKNIGTKGQLLDTIQVDFKTIKTITINSDYLYSLSTYIKSKKGIGSTFFA